MVPSNIEYILLRLIRRYLFTRGLLERFGQLFPYYRANCSQIDPCPIVDGYTSCLRRLGVRLAGQRIMEIGAGLTNSTAYELAARGCSKVYAVEPYAQFSCTMNEKLLRSIAKAHGIHMDEIACKVERLRDVKLALSKSIDIIFSHSVLEHVENPEQLFRELYIVLNADGIMIHIVDYRDHFFKYPFHMLLFSKKTWRRWLDPGDLPGWRMSQHVQMMEAAGYDTSIESAERDPENFAKVEHAISADYDRNDPYLDVVRGIIVARKK